MLYITCLRSSTMAVTNTLSKTNININMAYKALKKY